MKDIKFRAWHREYKKMLTVYVLHQGTYSEGFVKNCQGYVPPNDQYYFKFDDVEWMQYTGLKDKNGKEIYTGDIIEMIRIKDKKNSFVYFVGQVTDHGFAGITIDAKNDYMDFECKDYSYEVIGNIYENQVLLK
jgi:uncharacterized phage protein (TIGR01671 family)